MREAGLAKEKADLCVDEIQVRSLAKKTIRTVPMHMNVCLLQNKLWRHRIYLWLCHFIMTCLDHLSPGAGSTLPLCRHHSKNPRSSGEDGVYFRFRDGTVRLETTAFRNESGLSVTALDPEEFISNWAFEASPNEFLGSPLGRRSYRRQLIVFCTATISTHSFIQGGYRTNLQSPEIQWNRGIRHSVCIHESINLPVSMTWVPRTCGTFAHKLTSPALLQRAHDMT